MQDRRRIAILGGGVGGMAAAFHLTATPELRAQHQVTVYQLGWRLGGKGSSNRNPDVHQRIEEHGLHVWGGYYENAFAMMRACYAELGRDAAEPLATFEQAFLPQTRITWAERRDGKWIPWTVDLARNDGVPGAGGEPPTPAAYLSMLLPWMVQFFRAARQDAPATSRRTRAWLRCVATLSASVLSASALDGPESHRRIGFRQLMYALVWLLDRFMDALWADLEGALGDVHALRRLAIVLDLAAAYVRGMIADDVLDKGFDVIDEWDYAEWLTRHGARPQTVSSAAVRAAYDYYFSYEGGDPARPRLAAGAGLRSIFRLLLTYQGAVFWKLAAGMGETVFAPLYQVLVRRGVEFAFFQPVRELVPAQAEDTIDRILLGVQAELKPGVERYDPLVDVNGLPCFRDRPDASQLVQGAALEARGVDLESPWSGWQDVDQRSLERGVHFDDLVLAVPPAALRTITRRLVDRSPRWQQMLDGVQTVATQAVQLWLRATPAQLGWRDGQTVLTGFAEPLDTWADFSHTLPFEAWPEGAAPASVIYMCSALQTTGSPPAEGASSWPDEQLRQVGVSTRRWLEQELHHLLPGATPRGSGRGAGVDDPGPSAQGSAPGFDWELLCAPSQAVGPDRLQHQLLRANVYPSDRYTLALPGTTAVRLRADGAGFANLYLAGDWVRTGLNLGSVESAVMSGAQAASAVSGQPIRVVGERDIP